MHKKDVPFKFQCHFLWSF